MWKIALIAVAGVYIVSKVFSRDDNEDDDVSVNNGIGVSGGGSGIGVSTGPDESLAELWVEQQYPDGYEPLETGESKEAMFEASQGWWS